MMYGATVRAKCVFSWLVTTPFYIMHVDMWIPGKLLDKDGKTLHLMNAMCELAQFVVSMLIADATAELLGKIFIEQVVFTFGLVAVVVVDIDSKCMSVFEDICNCFLFIFWPLSRRNYKGLSVERYHRFLNKTQIIIGHDCGTHQSFIENSKTSQYTWNSVPINGTGIPRCLAAVGHHFKFPMDVALSSLPTMNGTDHFTLYNYLHSVSNESLFATSVLQILIEEPRATHRDRWNNQRVAKNSKLETW